MDPADRIAAYLADELDDEQRRAFEDDLARDAALRADLDAVRRADDALAAQAPTPLPAGAEERLWARLTPELEAAYQPDAPVAAPEERTFTAAGGDELAARRGRRSPPWTAIGGIAAAIVAVAVVSVGILDPGRTDDAVDSLATDSPDDAPMMESAPEAADEGPLLRASGRCLRRRSPAEPDLGQASSGRNSRTSQPARSITHASARDALPSVPRPASTNATAGSPSKSMTSATATIGSPPPASSTSRHAPT